MSLNKLNILNKILNIFGAKSYRQTDSEKILDIISLLKPYNTEIPLIRIGSDGDGGYLVPDVMGDIKFCFSAGVGKLPHYLDKKNVKKKKEIYLESYWLK